MATKHSSRRIAHGRSASSPGASPIYVDASTLTLDAWLHRLDDESVLMVKTCFPSPAHRKEFVERLDEFDDGAIRRLLRSFLPRTGTHPIDEIHLASRIKNPAYYAQFKPSEYSRRLIQFGLSGGDYPVWEGVHWVLDLLPYHPREAIRVLSSFFVANCQYLPDAYMSGLSEARRLIRTKYIVGSGLRHVAQRVIDTLEWREFEFLVAAAWKKQGYRIKVTQGSKDGGLDVFAAKGKTSRAVLIQCKRWNTPVGRPECDSILGVMERARANQGVIVASQRFTRDARKLESEEPRLRLVDGAELIRILNGAVGPEWPNEVDDLIAEVQRDVPDQPESPKEERAYPKQKSRAPRTRGKSFKERVQ